MLSDVHGEGEVVPKLTLDILDPLVQIKHVLKITFCMVGRKMARPQEFNRSEALHQAMDLFWQKSYEATSMADLLKAMGLSKSSLYGSFGGKYQLFVAAFDAYRAEREREAEVILNRGTAREGVADLFQKIVSDVRAGDSSRGCMSINQAVEMAPRSPEISSRVLKDFTLIEDMLTRTIRAREVGRICKEYRRGASPGPPSGAGITGFTGHGTRRHGYGPTRTELEFAAFHTRLGAGAAVFSTIMDRLVLIFTQGRRRCRL